MVMDVQIDVKRAMDKFEAAKHQVPLAVSYAMNRVVYQIAVGESGSGVLRKEIDRKLDKGAERFTLSGIQYTKSNKRNLVAAVVADYTGGRIPLDGVYKKGAGAGFNKREYLRTILHGGDVRPPKPGRKNLIQPVIGNVKLNKHGNLNVEKKFIPQRKQAESKGIMAGSVKKPKLKFSKKTGKPVGKAPRYFYGTPRNKPKSDGNYGLWERIGRTQKTPYGKSIRMIIRTGNRTRKQRQQVRGNEISLQYAMRAYRTEFARGMAMAMRTSKSRSMALQQFDERRRS